MDIEKQQYQVRWCAEDIHNAKVLCDTEEEAYSLIEGLGEFGVHHWTLEKITISEREVLERFPSEIMKD